MPNFEGSPYVTELNGSINGKPHTIQMDIRRVLTERAEREGRIMSDSELEEECQKLLEDIERTKTALTVKPQEVSIRGLFSRHLTRKGL